MDSGKKQDGQTGNIISRSQISMVQDGHRKVHFGYFPDSKMYYKGKAAWGGTSWDNQALFDINGYPLQSLKFYKDSVSKGKRADHSIEDR